MNTSKLEHKLGYHFADPHLLLLALTHRSYDKLHNERLEFLGDSVLGCAISHVLYCRYPEATEGRLSRMRSHLVRGKTLSKIALALELPKMMRLGTGEHKSGGRTRERLLANCLEAVIGAVYLDSSSLHTTSACIEKIYSHLFDDLETIEQFKDAKSLLQEWLQARHHPLPEYTLVEESYPPQQPRFTVSCQTSLLQEPVVCTAATKRAAEQMAAQQLLKQLDTSFVSHAS